MKRRAFTRLCTSMIAAAAAGATNQSQSRAQGKTAYPRSRLHREGNQPLASDSITPGVPYLFFYPFISTPCFLIDLGNAPPASSATLQDANGNDYRWHGGVGPNRSIVAYSAICAHKMSHPAREISFINYRQDPVSFYNSAGEKEERTQVISCCSENSVYDPANGARVLAGPASQPLASIELEYSSDTGELYATASYGGDMYDRFFETFGFRAAMEHKVSDPATLVGNKSAVHKLSDYSRQTIEC